MQKKTKNIAVGITKTKLPVENEYTTALAYLKQQIQEARLKAVTAVNTEMVRVYWNIGRTISDKERKDGWGARVIGKLSKDLTAAFPDMKGLSPRNLLYMRQFYDAYHNIEITQQPVAQIPWGHNILLLEKIKSTKERLWYANKTIENGWSRAILVIWIENDLYNREGKAITNFRNTLPPIHSDLAQQATKDPYLFDFLSIDERFREKELEQGLIDHIQNLLMEFGRGFAFIGRQCELVIDGKGFLVDLLFYHVPLHCYVVVELLCCAQHNSSYVA